MTTKENEFTDEELEQELGSWRVEPLNNGFAQSYKTLYKTYKTTVAVKSFLVPNKVTGEIRHFGVSLRVFKRRKKDEPWVEQLNESINPFGNRRELTIDAGNGKAVRELTNFLLAQYELVGTKVDSKKVIIDQPTDMDVEEFIDKLSFGQLENFGQGVKIQSLKAYKRFLEQNLDKNEAFIQNWLDADNYKYRKQRCLIFGLEYIDHKREGELSRKRFDILTRSSMERNEYVIIELKSPCDEIFKVETRKTAQGESVEYHLSPQLSRAIPQILRYKSKLTSLPNDDDDLRRIGISKGNVNKCIILLGQKRENDPIWMDHFNSLKANLSNSLEVWTYTDLIDKLTITIKNLEENLNAE